jgi:hypothetical protein
MSIWNFFKASLIAERLEQYYLSLFSAAITKYLSLDDL